MMHRRTMILGLPAGLLAGPATTSAANAADDDAAAWEALRSGAAAILMRHAIAPGGGDPAGFRVDDCSTQRLLSDTGRDQARQVGAALRAKGIGTAQVLSSAWCRCLETAELLGLGDVRVEPALNSFFQDRRSGPEQTEALRVLLRDWTRPLPLVLVTHQVNITALTRVFPASGECVLVYTRDRAGDVALRFRLPSA